MEDNVSQEEIGELFRRDVRHALKTIDPAQVGLAVQRAHNDAGEPEAAQNMLDNARSFSSLSMKRQQSIVAEEAVEWRKREASKEMELGEKAQPEAVDESPVAPASDPDFHQGAEAVAPADDAPTQAPTEAAEPD